MTVVAIDGPAGAGKSTVARAVARALQWRYLDTGALYRVVALAALERGLELDDGEALGKLARELAIDVDGSRALVGGRDVTKEIRAPKVSAAVSGVSARPEVRSALIDLQRRASETSDVVIEGRDIGTTVVPDADVKIFLTATLDERARRRCAELMDDCDEKDLASVRADLAARDEADAAREASPLRRAADAVEIDSTGKTIDDVVHEIVAATEAAIRRG